MFIKIKFLFFDWLTIGTGVRWATKTCVGDFKADSKS